MSCQENREHAESRWDNEDWEEGESSTKWVHRFHWYTETNVNDFLGQQQKKWDTAAFDSQHWPRCWCRLQRRAASGPWPHHRGHRSTWEGSFPAGMVEGGQLQDLDWIKCFNNVRQEKGKVLSCIYCKGSFLSFPMLIYFLSEHSKITFMYALFGNFNNMKVLG